MPCDSYTPRRPTSRTAHPHTRPPYVARQIHATRPHGQDRSPAHQPPAHRLPPVLVPGRAFRPVAVLPGPTPPLHRLPRAHQATAIAAAAIPTATVIASAIAAAAAIASTIAAAAASAAIASTIAAASIPAVVAGGRGHSCAPAARAAE